MFKMAVDASDFLKRTGDLMNRDLSIIETWALNWTADEAVDALKHRMSVVFDRPTKAIAGVAGNPKTGAFYVWRARKSTREAVIEERGALKKKHFLKVQNQGGPRPQTALEKLVEARVVSAQILRAVVPASGAKLNSYGNWSPGERNQALSEIGAQRQDMRRGATANATAQSIARARKRGRASYFVPTNGGLSPGIWKRTRKGDLSKVAHFVDHAPRYTPLLNFEGVISRIYTERLEINLRRAFERAMKNPR
ncbi:hypothetical protein [Pararhodobacter zhoushanensis]|uniref:hypothetical protein n=1 Tax=Pararhodobacter zhoushanensis TaxID=2479545 RepID=UPI000F8C380D|nr:hypothetical protein [Pararhodobacter zhoushanensis]